MQPGDALDHVGAGLPGVGGGPLQSDAGDVDSSDVPTAPGQPDGVGALPATDVERGTGR